MTLAPRDQWLLNIGTLPKIVAAALQYLGVKEIPGAASNPVIIDMAQGLGVGKIYTNDDTSWCALFINHLLRITGKPAVNIAGNLYNYLRAKWMLHWGNEVKLEDAVLGDIVILDREGGGHVFILLGFTKDGHLIGIGGNQGNQVSIAQFSKDRVLGVRRYYATGLPASAKRYTIDSLGKMSANEA